MMRYQNEPDYMGLPGWLGGWLAGSKRGQNKPLRRLAAGWLAGWLAASLRGCPREHGKGQEEGREHRGTLQDCS